MKIYVCKDYKKASEVAANIVASHIVLKPDSVLGLATGSTPVGMYEELVKKYNNGEISFKEIKTFNLDEYVGIEKEDINSYYSFMFENLFNKVDIDVNNVNIPDGKALDFELFSKEYEEKISASGGIDIQVLGIGQNAHIGFNEPDTIFYQNTRVVDLTEDTIEANSRFFDNLEDVPKKALSMGIGTIMRSKNILLIANGKSKAEAIRNMLVSEIDPQIPASILKLHPSVTVVLDEEAASLIEK